MQEAPIRVENLEIMPDISALAKKLGMEDASRSKITHLEQLAEQAVEIATPMGVAIKMPLEAMDKTGIKIGGQQFSSELLYENTSGLKYVFPYMCTEGAELGAWAHSLAAEDQPIAHALRQLAVKSCEAAIEKKILEHNNLTQISAMNPGSLVQWPLGELLKIFRVLAPYPEELGVELLPSGFMNPGYSISGIFFQTETKFYNCQLCPRENCPNRKAPRKN